MLAESTSKHNFYFMIDFWNIYDAIQLPDKNFIRHIVNTRVSSQLTIIKHVQKLFEIMFSHLSAGFMSHQNFTFNRQLKYWGKACNGDKKIQFLIRDWESEKNKEEREYIFNSHASM